MPVLLFVLWLFVPTALAGQPAPAALAPVHTYSIVARDPDTGDMGVAVQSHWFSVGQLVAWGEAGVGVVATQSFIDPSYGSLGLALMKAGRSATEALTGLVAADPHPQVRQVAMLDATGNVAVHTGANCIPFAGHLVGENFAVQANLMLDEAVWTTMAEAFQRARGDLAERLLAALQAAQDLGGDLRGKQSAAILIVRGEATGRPWVDRAMDLRVEDHPDPVQELKRLVKLHRAYEHMNRGDLAIESGDEETALQEYAAAEALFPDNLEMRFWHAVSLVNMNRVEEALALFRTIFAADSNWAVLVPRLVQAGLLKVDEETLEEITAAAVPAPAPEQ